MDVLVFLAAHPGEVVSKQQLLDGVWGGRAVSDDALTGSIYQLRKVLGDDARSPRFIETLPKRGYRLLVAPGAVSEGRSPASRRLPAVATVALLLVLALVLAGSLPRAQRRPPPEAVEAYLRGRALLGQRVPPALEQSRLDFERALAIHPGYAEAFAGIAEGWFQRIFLGLERPADLYPRARAAALRALELDPDLAEARVTLAMVTVLADHDLERGEEELRRALRSRPVDAGAHRWYAYVLACLGRPAEAVAETRQALRLAPQDLTIHRDASEIFLLARDYDAVVHQGEKTLALSPNFADVHLKMAWALALQGRDAEAYAAFRAALLAVGVEAGPLEDLDRVHATEGLPGVYRAMARWLEGAAPVLGGGSWIDLAVLHAAAGNRDRAFAWIEQGVRRQDPFLVLLPVTPLVDGLRSDPRFPRLLRRLRTAHG